jgi:hypothetical protein
MVDMRAEVDIPGDIMAGESLVFAHVEVDVGRELQYMWPAAEALPRLEDAEGDLIRHHKGLSISASPLPPGQGPISSDCGDFLLTDRHFTAISLWFEAFKYL